MGGEWEVEKREEERRRRKKTKRQMFMIWSIVPSTTLLSPLHRCLVLLWSTGVSWGSTVPPYITTSTKSLLPSNTHKIEWPLVSTLREVEKILQHSRAVIQEAPSCLKVSSRLLSVPHEMVGDSSLRHVEGKDSRGSTHCVFDTLVCTHPHKDRYIYGEYTHMLRCVMTKNVSKLLACACYGFFNVGSGCFSLFYMIGN